MANILSFHKLGATIDIIIMRVCVIDLFNFSLFILGFVIHRVIIIISCECMNNFPINVSFRQSIIGSEKFCCNQLMYNQNENELQMKQAEYR